MSSSRIGNGRRRVKISATLDPVLLETVDAYVRQHPGVDRSAVLDEAISLWVAQQQDQAMIEQFAGDDAPDDERLAWRRIQRAAAERVFSRDG